MRTRRARLGSLAFLLWIGAAASSSATAQDLAPRPPLPDPTPAASPTPGTDDPTRLADQVRKLIEMNQKLSDQLGDLSQKYDDLNKRLDQPASGGGGGGGESGGNSNPGGEGASSRGSASTSRSTGGAPRNQAESQVVGNRHIGKVKTKTSYDFDREGFVFETEDSEYQLKFRALFQGDARVYQQAGQDPVHGGFGIPRMRLYFSGRMTKPIEYQIVLQEGFDSFNLLNAFVNYHYDDRFQFRFGRFKTPYTYEFYKIGAQELLMPERSIFNVNFQGNRQVGLMGNGELFDNKVEYAVGAFDGGRNSFQPFHNGLDVIALLNIKPFEGDGSFLQNLNVGGSVDYGYENNPLAPAVLRTSSQVSSSQITSTSTTNTFNTPFLAFNQNVRERGTREQWELHMAYFYKGLSALAAWDAGYNTFSTSKNSPFVAVPIGGYFVQLAYLVTGETRNDNGLIDPLHPFDLRRGKFGLGAIEPTVRFSTINLGRDVFTGGLADPNLWTNNAYMVDLGFNWYQNKFAKIYFDWQHADFGDPVRFAPGRLQKTSDLFWLRFQVYF